MTEVTGRGCDPLSNCTTDLEARELCEAVELPSLDPMIFKIIGFREFCDVPLKVYGVVLEGS